MPFCSHCGKEIDEEASFCNNCGGKLIIEGRSKTQSRKSNKIVRFVIGLIVVGAICGILRVAEDASLPLELRTEIALVERMRQLPPEIQWSLARQRGITVEELLTSPYERWAPKAAIGLLSAYAFAGLIYFTFGSSKSSADS
jgi:DNA-directed RNA polymerase subunit RPC12/RpoP